ncbi:response regulator [Leptothoe kymatousa TAU-MAC 1615]|uniref:Response regulator n=1 Tax=Leptothoe kymatousa TAU-MAC 1615 TaxID=2364775 RepID=A0ABS5Y2E1_9CYAN|nr:response regulator [Leptothoe kymatousa TAU-MAC 1615]
MRGDRDQALAAGCDDYDTKPIDLKRLLGKIKSFLSSEQLADASDTPKPIVKAPPASTAPVVPIKPVTTTPAVVQPVRYPEQPIAAEAWLPLDQRSPEPPAAPIQDDPWGTPGLSDQNSWGPPVQSTIVVSDNESATPLATDGVQRLDQPAANSVTSEATTADNQEPLIPAAVEKANNIFSGLPILVVDDNEDNRDMLSRRLTRRGYESVVVDSGEAALAYIARHPEVALVLLDIMMPGIDGIETLKRLRKTYSRNELPVLMVTAKAQSDDMVRAFELGANDYITKPIDFAVTLARVETQLAIVKATKIQQPTPEAAAPLRPVASSPPTALKPPSSSSVVAPAEPAAAANISLVPKNSFSRFAADRYQVQYFLRQEPLGPLSIALDKHTDSLVLLQTLKAYSQDTADLLRRVMEKETEAFQPLRSLFPGYTYGQVDNTFYIVHGLGKNFSQDQLLQAKLQKPWSLESVLLLMDRLLEQVSVFHRHNQVHTGLRDDCFIQTQNWETMGQSMVLVDSGLGKRVMIGVSQQSAEYRKQLLMQRDYQPLEQRIARPVMSSDIYALGLIGLQALTGQSIDQLTLPSVSGELQWRGFAAIPDPIADWFEQLIHQSQNKRFGHAMAARNALTPHLQAYLAEPG